MSMEDFGKKPVNPFLPSDSGVSDSRQKEGDSEPPDTNGQEEAEKRYATKNRLDWVREIIESQDLPVRNRREELVQALKNCRERKSILLFQGETGSGKSVYSPGAVLEVLRDLGLPEKVFMVQPRKDAAAGVATAVAAIERQELGAGVGFSTSEAKRINPNTKIGVVTSGIFLRYLMNGTLTKDKVGAVIVDELHEGSIDYHLIMGLLKKMQESGDAPLVLLASATLNKDQIQQYFGIDDQDYLKIEGRTYPVKTRFLRESEQNGNGNKNEYIQKAVEAADIMLSDQEGGDILIFMPGAKEIRDTVSRLAELEEMEGVEILQLHGSLPPEDREKALSGRKPPGIHTRIVVATNVAETSVTVPGIKVVIDSCRKRSVKYNPATGIIEKGTEFISKDETEQRAGRAGRLGPGKALRVITKQDYENLPQHPLPEISKTNLSHLVLRLKKLGIHEDDFPFIVQPDKEAMQAGKEELMAMGALDKYEELTQLGAEMMDLPFEPRISRMVIEAKRLDCLEPALVMAAFSREDNVLLGPTKQDIEKAPGYSDKDKKITARKKVNEIQRKFQEGNSDWLTVLKIFEQAMEFGVFEAQRIGGKKPQWRTPDENYIFNKFKDWCNQNYLSPYALTHIAYRLFDYARYAGEGLDIQNLKNKIGSSSEQMSEVLLASHPDNLYRLLENFSRGMPEYQPVYKGKNMNISPGSVAFSGNPTLCIATRIEEGSGTVGHFETKRNYAQRVHQITAKAIRKIKPELVEVENGSIEYDTISGSVVRNDEVYWKDDRRFDRLHIGQDETKIHGPEGVAKFAQALAEAWQISSRDNLEFPNQNYTLLSNLTEAYKKRTGETLNFNLTEWYAQKLGKVCSIKELKKMLEADPDSFVLHKEDVIPLRLQEEIDKQYPLEVSIDQVKYRIDYTFIHGRHEAWLEVPVKELMHMTDTQIPTVGTPSEPKKLKIRVLSYNHTDLEGEDLERLKEKIDLIDAKIFFETAWKEKPQTVGVKVDIHLPLPSLSSLGYESIPYFKAHNGNKIQAFPFFEYEPAGKTWKIRYAYCAEAASKAQMRAEEYRLTLLAGEKAREAQDRLRQEDELAYRSLKPDLEKLLMEHKEIAPSIVKTLEYNLKSFEEYWDYRQSYDAYQIHEQILSLRRSLEKCKSDLKAFVEAKALYEKLTPEINQVLSESDRYLTYYQRRDLADAQGASFYTSDPVEALMRLKVAQQILNESKKQAVSLNSFKPADPVVEREQNPFAIAMQKARDKKVKPKTASVTVISQEQIEPEKIDAMTEIERLAFLERLDRMSVVLSINYGPRTTKPVTDKQKALAAYYEKIKELDKNLKVLRKDTYDENAKPSKLEGKILTFENSVDSLFKKFGTQLFNGTFEKNWREFYESLWDSIPQTVDEDAEVKEFIEAGMLERQDLIKKMQDKLISLVPDLQAGKVDDVDPAKWLKEIISRS